MSSMLSVISLNCTRRRTRRERHFTDDSIHSDEKSVIIFGVEKSRQ